MQSIKFSHNWNNKLHNAIFTTIRKSTKEKKKYYEDSVGKEFDVILKGKRIYRAKLLQVESNPYTLVPFSLRMSDTGMNLKKADQLFREFGISLNTEVLILTFENLGELGDE
jgi:hypothetical protein